jgi:TetR/AcrR family transcriptional regulator
MAETTVEKIAGRIPTRAELTRERILEAAEAVFARHGLNGTRIRTIAEAAGVNNATLYSYFPSKTDLYEAVIERGIRPLLDLVTEFSASAHDLAATEKLLREGMKHLGERPNLSRLIYLEIISEGSYLTELFSRWLQPLLGPGLTELEEATASTPWEGHLTPLIVTNFVQLSFGHFALTPLFRRLIGADPTSEEWVAHQTKFMVTLVEQMFPEQTRQVE